jgi:hypothetical protein
MQVPQGSRSIISEEDTFSRPSNKVGSSECPQPLTAQEINEFQDLVFETTGTRLDPDAAARRASEMLYLIRALIGRLPEEEGSNEFKRRPT